MHMALNWVKLMHEIKQKKCPSFHPSPLIMTGPDRQTDTQTVGS